MAKSSVATIITKIKRRADYNITDTDLDRLVVDIINDANKVLKQTFLDHGIMDEISVEGTITTTANQEYVDIATQLADLDEIIMQSERTNDRTIEVIPFWRYRELYPDPTANKTTTPFHAARHYNRIYFGPTPSAVLTIYCDYIKLLTDATSTSTMPFEAKYDPIVTAFGTLELLKWLDPTNAGIPVAKQNYDELKDILIIGAAKNIGMTRQAKSRNEGEGFEPRVPDNSYGYGFGVAGFGVAPFGG